MTPTGAADQFARSQRHLTAATQQWDAFDAAASEGVCESLQKAIAALESARTTLPHAEAAAHSGFISKLNGLRRDALRLSRLIDSAQAYCRGLALCLGSDAEPGCSKYSRGIGHA